MAEDLRWNDIEGADDDLRVSRDRVLTRLLVHHNTSTSGRKSDPPLGLQPLVCIVDHGVEGDLSVAEFPLGLAAVERDVHR